MRATVNGEERALAPETTIAALLESLGTPKNGIAVARNGEVIARALHESEYIADGDRIEIIRAVAGG